MPARGVPRASPSVERVLVASSDKAYGEHDEAPLHRGRAARRPLPYDVSKSCAEIARARSYHSPTACRSRHALRQPLRPAATSTGTASCPARSAPRCAASGRSSARDGRSCATTSTSTTPSTAYLLLAECLDGPAGRRGRGVQLLHRGSAERPRRLARGAGRVRLGPRAGRPRHRDARDPRPEPRGGEGARASRLASAPHARARVSKRRSRGTERFSPRVPSRDERLLFPRRAGAAGSSRARDGRARLHRRALDEAAPRGGRGGLRGRAPRLAGARAPVEATGPDPRRRVRRARRGRVPGGAEAARARGTSSTSPRSPTTRATRRVSTTPSRRTCRGR